MSCAALIRFAAANHLLPEGEGFWCSEFNEDGVYFRILRLSDTLTVLCHRWRGVHA
jgi:hypothetical protein